MANFLLERDTLKGSQGNAFVTVDGVVQEIFRAMNVEVSAEMQSVEMKAMGTNRVQQKPTSVKQTGTAKVYYGTDLFTQMMIKYVETGEMTYFDLQVTNNDPSSTIGAQTVVYYGCHLTGKLILSKLDLSSDMLEQDIEFAYTTMKKLSSFNTEATYGTD